jgi:hypothetical protein
MADTQRPAWMDAAPEAAQAYDEIVNDPPWGAIPEKKKAALMRKFARVFLAPELPGRGKDPAMFDFSRPLELRSRARWTPPGAACPVRPRQA